MSTAVSVYHGRFGRATLYRLNKPFATHAHREGHLAFLVDGPDASMNVVNRALPISEKAAVAVNAWQPHDFVPGDLARGSLFLILYIKPIWFLEAGRNAQSALRFGRNDIELTSQIRCSVSKVVSLLLDFAAPDLFDSYLYELTRECFDQSWQWTPNSKPVEQHYARFTDFRIRKSRRNRAR